MHELLDLDGPLHASQAEPRLVPDRLDVNEIGEMLGEEGQGVIGFVYMVEAQGRKRDQQGRQERNERVRTGFSHAP